MEREPENEKTGIGWAKSVHFSRRLCLRVNSRGNFLENCGPEKLCDLSDGDDGVRDFENFNNLAYVAGLYPSELRNGGRNMEFWRPGYLNMTCPDVTSNLPLGAEPLIYSYLVSSKEAGCYFQGRIRIPTCCSCVP